MHFYEPNFPQAHSMVLVILALLFVAQVAADETREMTLENGLRIIVKPDQRAPIAVFQIWYKVGSADEKTGKSGISHLLEHLMYKTIQTDPEGYLFAQMNRIGAQGNAFTTRDYSYYFHVLEKSHLTLAFQLEAERMQSLAPSERDFRIEKRIVQEEQGTRLTADPYLSAYDKLYKQAFEQSAYAHPIIGKREDVQNLTLADIMSWYQEYYQPHNAIIVVVGDIQAQTVFQLARQFFAPISNSSSNSKISILKNSALLIQQEDEKRYLQAATQVTTQAKTQATQQASDIQVGMLLQAYKVPVIKTAQPIWEAYALEVLAGWLDSGMNSRLSKTLVKERMLANQVAVIYSSLSRYDNLFIIEAIPAHGVSLIQLEQDLTAEIELLKQEKISAKKLARIKNQIIAAAIFERDSIHTQAKIIAQAEAIGIHWSDDAKYIKRIKSVTAQQVQAVLQKYFVTQGKTTIIHEQ